jgi:hypothetical protein
VIIKIGASSCCKIIVIRHAEMRAELMHNRQELSFFRSDTMKRIRSFRGEQFIDKNQIAYYKRKLFLPSY